MLQIRAFYQAARKARAAGLAPLTRLEKWLEVNYPMDEATLSALEDEEVMDEGDDWVRCSPYDNCAVFVIASFLWVASVEGVLLGKNKAA